MRASVESATSPDLVPIPRTWYLSLSGPGTYRDTPRAADRESQECLDMRPSPAIIDVSSQLLPGRATPARVGSQRWGVSRPIGRTGRLVFFFVGFH